MFLVVVLFTTVFSCQKNDIEAPERRDTPTFAAAYSSSNLLYEETFEGTSPFSNYVSKQIGTTYGFTVVSNPVFAGGKAGRFELRDTDPLTSSGTRAEVKFPELTNPNRWYSFSVYFPSADYQYDSKAEIINQWHQGGGVSPSISLITRYDKLVIESRTQPDSKTQYPLGNLVKDKWQTYVLHIIHSHGSDGLMEIWRDGVKIFTHNGPNSYDFANFDKPKWKIGLYKWDWNGTQTTDVHKRVVYFDNVRLGNENAKYADMIPGGSIVPAPVTPALPADTAKAPPAPAPAPAPAPVVPAPVPATGMAIKSFTLINSATERDVFTITDGQVISLKQLGLTKLNVRANPSSTVGSIKFSLSGPQSRSFTDDALPYALMGDDAKGNYFFGTWGPPPTGTYTLRAVPYSALKASGTMGTGSTIHFTITN